MAVKVPFEIASERLREALPMMSKRRIAVTPLNYTVWYEYVGKGISALTSEIDKMMERGDAIDERITEDLYQKHFSARASEDNEAQQLAVRKLIEAVGNSLAAADTEVARYEQSLHECEAQLNEDIHADDLKDVVSGLIASTNKMHEGNAQLQQHLEESRLEAEQLREELSKAKAVAITDALTGLANRHGFEQTLKELRESEDYRANTHALLIGDIDKFKSINDTYGHVFGDKILKVVAKAFSNLTKGKDLAARFGGEEFIILLPETDIKGAAAVAESIRSSIERGRVYNPKTGEEISRITISIGVTELLLDEDIDTTIARADEALYRAKEGGRNRVELADVNELLAKAG